MTYKGLQRKRVTELPLLNLRQYLQGTGWKQFKNLPEHITTEIAVFRRTIAKKEQEIVVPIRDDEGNYFSRRMAEAVSDLARYEDRDTTDVLQDLATGTGCGMTFDPQKQTSLLGPQDIRCVLMDPPWDRERGGGKIQRGADRHYPLMSVPDIHRCIVDDCEHWTRVCDTAHLWMWVTNPVLMSGEAHELAALLGFAAKTCFTWVKQTDEGKLQKGLGQYSMGSTEHLMLCTKGDFMKPETRHPTAFFAPRTEHSVKPEVSYQMVEGSSPGGYLEIFARRPRPGWVVWGNEVES